MAEATDPIPSGFTSVTPHLVVRGAADAIEFYKKAFGAIETMRMPTPDGAQLVHAQIKIGDSPVMLADEMPGGCSQSPQSLGGTAVAIHLYLPDVDKVFEKAVAAGAEPQMPPADMFWGDRYALIKDPFGHSWGLATHVSDPTLEEMQQGLEAAMSGGQEARIRAVLPRSGRHPTRLARPYGL